MEKWIATLMVLVLLCVICGVADFVCVVNFKEPTIARASETADDGGSGWYKGTGYTVYIEGNFMPEDEDYGVTHYEFYLFGNLVKSGSR